MSVTPLDHTGDVGFVIESEGLDRLFEEAALALLETITDSNAVRAHSKRTIRLSAAEPDLLLVDWLQELLFVFETQEFLFRDTEVAVSRHERGFALRGVARGETYDPARHAHRVAVKAITYHGLELRREGRIWRARVIFDI